MAFFAAVIWLVFGSDAVFAASDYGDIEEAHSSFTGFLTAISAVISNLLSPTSNAAQFVNAEFIAFATYRLTIVVGKWAFDSADLVEVFSVVMLIAIVQILIDFYDVLTTGLLTWSGDFAGVISNEITGTDDVFFTVSYLSNLSDSITFEEGGWSIIPDVVPAFLMLLCFGLLWLLGTAAFVGMAWAIWGFALAKLIGWFFIPFLLLERTAELFDSWLRFLIGFLFYAVIIRVNMALVVLLLSAYFGVPMTVGENPEPIIIEVDSFSNVAGFIALYVVGILSIFATGKFATAIAGGVGGFGGTLGRVAMAGAAGASRFIK
ncbi:type IV secretion system protein [Methylophaga sp.]|uniref:type IV secretion system protein n=1 Tax=Methylophaga sp. TaxID=2024840 RepID=UPI003A8F2CE4